MTILNSFKFTNNLFSVFTHQIRQRNYVDKVIHLKILILFQSFIQSINITKQKIKRYDVCELGAAVCESNSPAIDCAVFARASARSIAAWRTCDLRSVASATAATTCRMYMRSFDICCRVGLWFGYFFCSESTECNNYNYDDSNIDEYHLLRLLLRFG